MLFQKNVFLWLLEVGGTRGGWERVVTERLNFQGFKDVGFKMEFISKSQDYGFPSKLHSLHGLENSEKKLLSIF